MFIFLSWNIRITGTVHLIWLDLCIWSSVQQNLLSFGLQQWKLKAFCHIFQVLLFCWHQAMFFIFINKQVYVPFSLSWSCFLMVHVSNPDNNIFSTYNLKEAVLVLLEMSDFQIWRNQQQAVHAWLYVL